MNWHLALKHNHDTLLRIAAGLFALLGLQFGQTVESLPRHQRRVAFLVLRPSESALRRLLLVAAFVYASVALPMAERVVRVTKGARSSTPAPRKQNAPPFKLIDPRKAFYLFPNRPKARRPVGAGPGPFISDPFDPDSAEKRRAHFAEYERRMQARREEPSAKALCHRLNALMAALEDLPHQARRMVTLQARIAQSQTRRGKPILPPLRPGLPPGHRAREKYEVDAVLKECHTLARWVLNGTGPPLEPQ